MPGAGAGRCGRAVWVAPRRPLRIATRAAGGGAKCLCTPPATSRSGDWKTHAATSRRNRLFDSANVSIGCRPAPGSSGGQALPTCSGQARARRFGPAASRTRRLQGRRRTPPPSRWRRQTDRAVQRREPGTESALRVAKGVHAIRIDVHAPRYGVENRRMLRERRAAERQCSSACIRATR